MAKILVGFSRHFQKFSEGFRKISGNFELELAENDFFKFVEFHFRNFLKVTENFPEKNVCIQKTICIQNIYEFRYLLKKKSYQKSGISIKKCTDGFCFNQPIRLQRFPLSLRKKFYSNNNEQQCEFFKNRQKEIKACTAKKCTLITFKISDHSKNWGESF